MDMQINSNWIKAERERRAWSQEHLATAAGLSLRTVQRVETAGSASPETVRALAAVFGVDLAALRMPAAQPAQTAAFHWRYAAIAASAVVALGLLVTREVRAGDVQLDVALTLNKEKLSQSQIVAPEGKSAEIRLEKQARLFVNPIVAKDGSILLSIRLEEPAGSRWVEIGEPKIMVADGNEGVVKVTSPKGNVFEIAIRPRRM
jgi:transcriptional regulator with XRE-family HTH domain